MWDALVDRRLRGIVLLTLGAGVSAVFLGILLDARGYTGNLLAEIAGVVLGAVFVLAVLNRVQAVQRARRWDRIRSLTIGAIAGHVCDIATDMLIFFPVRNQRPMTAIVEGRDKPHGQTPEALQQLEKELESLPNSVSKHRSTSDVAVEFFEEVGWDLDRLTTVLLPRVMEISDDQPLIDGLARVDDAVRRLNNSIISHKRVVTHGVMPDVIHLLRSLRELYALVLARWE